MTFCVEVEVTALEGTFSVSLTSEKTGRLCCEGNEQLAFERFPLPMRNPKNVPVERMTDVGFILDDAALTFCAKCFDEARVLAELTKIGLTPVITAPVECSIST